MGKAQKLPFQVSVFIPVLEVGTGKGDIARRLISMCHAHTPLCESAPSCLCCGGCSACSRDMIRDESSPGRKLMAHIQAQPQALAEVWKASFHCLTAGWEFCWCCFIMKTVCHMLPACLVPSLSRSDLPWSTVSHAECRVPHEQLAVAYALYSPGYSAYPHINT